MSQMGHALIACALSQVTYELIFQKYFMSKEDYEFMQSGIVGRLLGHATFLIIIACIVK